ncbi:MAG: hypothetical protein FWE57_00040 [Chitinispirillia bacterium]|nr:hypothetical protein [Chitinispirillia bacterium]
MDLNGLLNNISNAAASIDSGRKGFAVIGEERAGRIAYEEGIADALSSFKQAQTSADPQTIILAEYTFLSQELHFCPQSDTSTFRSLTQAIQSFDDAFLCLEIVEDHSAYQRAEKTYLRHKNYRVDGFPKDAFHVACTSHKTRLGNVIRSPGIDLIEKSLLNQRVSNLTAARSSYVKKQNLALTILPSLN